MRSKRSGILIYKIKKVLNLDPGDQEVWDLDSGSKKSTKVWNQDPTRSTKVWNLDPTRSNKVWNLDP